MQKFREGKLEWLKPKEQADRGESRAIRAEIISETVKRKVGLKKPIVSSEEAFTHTSC
jgi:hypothetical protein